MGTRSRVDTSPVAQGCPRGLKLRVQYESHTPCGFHQATWRGFYSGNGQTSSSLTGPTSGLPIELNVATVGHPHFKDASDLSRGQKCTALLPILLARRDNPLIIDQPEDNLDNHFIFETVVNAVQRMKKRRQMIFITHNANIPVLAEAELVLVMTSDGRVGAIERRGTVDECREQIIDLLEGGREAFELRSKRYAAG